MEEDYNEMKLKNEAHLNEMKLKSETELKEYELLLTHPLEIIEIKKSLQDLIISQNIKYEKIASNDYETIEYLKSKAKTYHTTFEEIKNIASAALCENEIKVFAKAYCKDIAKGEPLSPELDRIISGIESKYHEDKTKIMDKAKIFAEDRLNELKIEENYLLEDEKDPDITAAVIIFFLYSKK